MRPSVLLLLASLLLYVAPARAQSSDPGDLFVNAYMAVQAGEKAEREAKYKDATSKYRYAAQVLDQISDRFPTWQPSIIDYRKKRTAEAIGRMQDKIAHVGGGKGDPQDNARAGTDTGSPPAGADSRGLFSPPEDVLPGTPPLSGKEKRSADRRVPPPDLPTNNPMQELEDRMAKLQKDLSKARADVKKTQDEKEALAKELAAASKTRAEADKKRDTLLLRADTADKLLEKAKLEGKADSDQAKKVLAELSGVKKQLRDLKLEADAETEYRQQLGDRVRAAQAKIVRLTTENANATQASAEVPGQISALQKQIDATRAEKNDLVIRLAKTESDLKSVQAQRDDALAQVAHMKEAQKQVDKLLADNAELMTKLGVAERNLMAAKEGGAKKDQEIAGLRTETSALRVQLDKAQKEGANYQRQMADLQQRLTEANSQIVQMKADTSKGIAERGKLQEENQILRGIIHREQIEEARRSQTKKLVLSELAKMENKSKVLVEQIDMLSSPVVKLTEKERRLFKKPELQISDTEITLTAPRSEPAIASVEPTLPQQDPATMKVVIPPVAVATPAPAPAPAATRAVASTKPAPNTPPPAPAVAPAPAGAPASPPRTEPPVAAVASRPDPGFPEVPKSTPAGKKGRTASGTQNSVVAPPLPSKNDKPALTLETGVKPNLDLASNKHVTAPFSSLPDDLRGRPMDKTPEPARPPQNPPETPVAKASASEKGSAPEAPLTTSTNAVSNVSTAVMNLPPDLIPQAREGKDLFERGNYHEAERAYEKILTKAPGNLYTLSNLGVVYFREQKYPRAEEMFRKAIAIAPEDGFSHCTLGIVFYSQQKYDLAVDELMKALTINNKNATAHNYLGITASQKGWQDTAEKELVTATSLDPNYADAFFNLAVVYATQKPVDKEKAKKCYKRANELGAEPDTALEQLIK